MAGHTEGPWTIPTPSMGFSEIRGGSGELIFGLAAGGPDEKQDDDTCEANARLIAAAPNLLAIAKRWIALDGSAWHPERYARERTELLGDTRDAIAGAEGQP